MRRFSFITAAILCLLLSVQELRSSDKSQSQTERAQQLHETRIAAGSKVYIAPMEGFETYLKAAIIKKQVPLHIVDQRDLAVYEITGTSESKKAGAAKILIMGSWHSREEASIRLANIKTGDVVFAYSVHKENSAHGKKSSAEACAKHLKDEAVNSK